MADVWAFFRPLEVWHKQNEQIKENALVNREEVYLTENKVNIFQAKYKETTVTATVHGCVINLWQGQFLLHKFCK